MRPGTPVVVASGSGLGTLKKMDAVRRIVRSWRELTSAATSRRTVVACSGGADSGALALALAAAGRGLLIAHVVHDLRPEPVALADRDVARALAERLGLPFVEARVRCRTGGNLEAAARRARHRALADIAIAHHAPFVATAHHADDQLETMVMAMIRGAGPAGLAGVAPSRSLAPGVTLIRPMLTVGRADAEAICAAGAFRWAIDLSNADTTLARAALRHGPIADIARARPGAAARASRAADHLRDASALVDQRVHDVFGDRCTWPRESLRAETALVVGAGLRRAALRLAGGRGADRLGSRVVDSAVRAARDDSTEPRSIEWRLRGTRVIFTVRAREVRVERA
ncbi:MAG: tRNA lysidine(34) synthetase TilS [Phycisphaerales bacterium]|nr:tRNA lysidine(34) synthetase TilS [Phycisphaerales bacterium]